MTREELIGHHELPNGYTVSIIGHGYGAGSNLLEAWHWDANGESRDEDGETVDPEGWLTEGAARVYLRLISERPSANTSPTAIRDRTEHA